MRLSDFDYELPEELIAQEPLADRASSRLLVVPRDGNPIRHHIFRDLPSLLAPNDLLVLNDTRVTARRLLGKRSTGAAVEFLVMHPTGEGTYEALVRNAAKVKLGEWIDFGDGLEGQIVGATGEGVREVRLRGSLEGRGMIPLPPYIHTELANEERYQTTYAHHGGSAAAPTAGLHFTPELLKSLSHACVTLDVSIDTFRPVTVDDTSDHQMHGEVCRISPETAAQINDREGRLIAVGTTAVRTLESFAQSGKVTSGETKTRIFIQPGYEFQVVQGLITNFHMPRTTMLLMLAAMIGRERLMEAYEIAVAEQYRFLSFGDSMLIL